MSFQNLFNESNQSINLIIAVDNISIDYNSTGQLEIKNGGVSTVKIANLAVTNAKISDMDASKLIGTITIPIDNVLIETERIMVSDQNENTPSYTFKNDQDTGIFRAGDNALGFSAGATNIMTVYPDRVVVNFYGMTVHDELTVDGDLEVLSGVIKVNYIGPTSSPSLTFGSLSNGLYYSNLNTISLKSNNVETLRMINNLVECFTAFKATSLSATGIISGDNVICNTITTGSDVTVGGKLILSSGSNTAPSLYFTGDTTTGIYKNGPLTLSITSNSNEVARFNDTLIQFFRNISMSSNTINCGGITLGSLTAKGALFLNSSNDVTASSAMTDGQLLIGSTSGNPAAANIIGTSNQVFVTNGSNSIKLSLPQNINSAAAPSFGGGFINGTLVVGKTAPIISTGYNTLQLYGNNANSAGPHIQAFTSSDFFPVFQQLNWSHDNIAMNFDCYYDGQFRSSYATSNFQIYKINDTLSINYGPGNTPGSIVTLNTRHALTVDTTGMVTIPNTLAAGTVYVSSTTASPNGSGKLQILGGSGATVNSPSILCSCTSDVYPLLNIMPFAHDAVELLFDAWRMPSNIWQSGSANSNFRLSKGSTTFTLNYASGVTLGSNISWSNGWEVNTSGQFSIGKTIINTGMQKLMIYGPNNSVNGPHIQTFTSSDNFPLLQVMSLQHNNVTLGFDTYYDGSGYLSSNSGSNFVLGKVSNSFQLLCGTGAAQGTTPTLSVASSWDASGNFTCNQNFNGTKMSLSAQPCLMMSASTYISVSPATPTKFTGFDTQDYSTGSIGFSSGTATIPSTGTYLVTCEMTFDSNSLGTGNYDEVYIYKNGSNIYGRQRISNSPGNIMYLTTSAQMRLITNDTIEIYVAQNSGFSLHIGTISGGTGRLEITKLF